MHWVHSLIIKWLDYPITYKIDTFFITLTCLKRHLSLTWIALPYSTIFWCYHVLIWTNILHWEFWLNSVETEYKSKHMGPVKISALRRLCLSNKNSSWCWMMPMPVKCQDKSPKLTEVSGPCQLLTSHGEVPLLVNKALLSQAQIPAHGQGEPWKTAQLKGSSSSPLPPDNSGFFQVLVAFWNFLVPLWTFQWHVASVNTRSFCCVCCSPAVSPCWGPSAVHRNVQSLCEMKMRKGKWGRKENAL